MATSSPMVLSLLLLASLTALLVLSPPSQPDTILLQPASSIFSYLQTKHDYTDRFHVSTDISIPWLYEYPTALYSPHLDTAPPRWVHLAYGLLLFLYQIFDIVDGKEARRTNSSSPLGELFDHGCDALACAFESLAFGSTTMCGKATFWFWVISAVQINFATWEQ